MNSARQPRKQTGSFWTPRRAALTLTVFALLIASSIAGCNHMKHGENENANSTKVSMTVKQGAHANAAANTAPSGEAVMLPASALDAPLKTIDGKPFKLSELKGKVLVIDLWATWCGPCRYEVPELVKIQSEYGPRGVEVIGLDIDPSEAPEDVKKFAKDFEINYKVAFADRSLAVSLMSGGNIPQSIVVSRDGRVLVHMRGFHPVNTAKGLRAAIEQGLSE